MDICQVTFLLETLISGEMCIAENKSPLFHIFVLSGPAGHLLVAVIFTLTVDTVNFYAESGLIRILPEKFRRNYHEQTCSVFNRLNQRRLRIYSRLLQYLYDEGGQYGTDNHAERDCQDNRLVRIPASTGGHSRIQS